MRRAVRRLARAVGLTLLAALGFALVFPVAYAMVVDPPQGPMVELPMPPAGEYTIYVADWDYHTSIVLPQPSEWRLGPVGDEHAAFVEYAWGDRRFYRDSDYRPHSVFATIALPTASVAYIEGRVEPPRAPRWAEAVYTRRVDARTLHALAVELERTVSRRADGGRVPPAARVAGFRGVFHDAYGSYLWTRSCNRWTVDRLAAVGLADHGRFVVFSGQVAGRLRGFAPAID